MGNTFSFGKRLRLYALVDFRRGNRCTTSSRSCAARASWAIGFREADYPPGEILADLSRRACRTPVPRQGINDQFFQDGFAKLREISADVSRSPTASCAEYDGLVHARRRASCIRGRKYTGSDPEINYNANAGNAAAGPQNQNFDQGVLPPLSRITASLNITF